MTRRLHIVIAPAWYPSPEDPVAGVFVRDQARAVAVRHDVTVLAPASPASPPSSVEDGVRTIRLPGAPGRGKLASLARLRAFNSAIARLRKEGQPPDVLHAHMFSAGLLTVLAGRRWRLPVVVSEHLTDVIDGTLAGWDARVARYVYRHAGLVCPVSPLLEQGLVHLEPRARYEVVGNVVDIDAFAGPPRPARPRPGRRVLTVAGLAGYKGLPHLLEAFRLLVRERPDVTLEIVGDGPDSALLEALAEGLPVTFLGALPRAEVAARMRDADVLAMPSLVETFGITVIEALASALPVVCTSAFPVADLVAAQGGLVVPPADVPALHDALATLLDGTDRVPPPITDELRGRYGPEAIAEHWDTIYRSLARAPHR